MRNLILTSTVLLSLAACSSSSTAVRNGPQAVSPVTGEVDYTTSTFISTTPVPPSGNEYNRNAGIYRSGFEGALAASTTR